MKKQNTKGSQKNKESAIITEQDRTNNPIFKAIYKRVRNLTKKLNNISALLDQDESTLKPEQLQKIHARPEVEAQIAKNQEFAIFYKSILIQNGGVTFDNTEEIMKVATFLAVGSHLNSFKTATKSNKMKSIIEHYKQTVNHKWDNNQTISDVTASTFTSLNQFLGSSKKYEICKDYISDVAEKQEHQAEIEKDEAESPEKVEQKQQKNQKKYKAKTVQQQEVIDHPFQLEQQSKIEPEKQTQSIVKSLKQQQKAQKPQIKQSRNQTTEEETAPKIQKNQEHPKNSGTRGNRNYNNKGYNRPQQNTYNGGYNNNNNYNRNYNSRNQYGNNGNNQYNNGKDENWKNKDNYNRPKKQVREKSNDTSLESTPEKLRPQKPKYILKQ